MKKIKLAMLPSLIKLFRFSFLNLKMQYTNEYNKKMMSSKYKQSPKEKGMCFKKNDLN
jgi:hypothetical protein